MNGNSTPDPLAAIIHNEQIKLRASALNLIAVGFVVAGIITPLAVLLVGTASTAVPAQAFATMALWIVSAFILHMGATLTLRSLR